MKSNKNELGFSVFGTIFAVVLLIVLIGAGYFAYQLVKDNKNNLTTKNAKDMITNQVGKTKNEIDSAASSAATSAINEIKDSAANSAKGAVNDTVNNVLGK
ncbi:MAG TPA: hypothetical protein P5096_03920 [Patescibacteria group bacterium]|nr:hypothetical protein [Patescibacteria group bacterium]